MLPGFFRRRRRASQVRSCSRSGQPVTRASYVPHLPRARRTPGSPGATRGGGFPLAAAPGSSPLMPLTEISGERQHRLRALAQVVQVLLHPEQVRVQPTVQVSRVRARRAVPAGPPSGPGYRHAVAPVAAALPRSTDSVPSTAQNPCDTDGCRERDRCPQRIEKPYGTNRGMTRQHKARPDQACRPARCLGGRPRLLAVPPCQLVPPCCCRGHMRHIAQWGAVRAGQPVRSNAWIPQVVQNDHSGATRTARLAIGIVAPNGGYSAAAGRG